MQSVSMPRHVPCTFTTPDISLKGIRYRGHTEELECCKRYDCHGQSSALFPHREVVAVIVCVDRELYELPGILQKDCSIVKDSIRYPPITRGF